MVAAFSPQCAPIVIRAENCDIKSLTKADRNDPTNRIKQKNIHAKQSQEKCVQNSRINELIRSVYEKHMSMHRMSNDRILNSPGHNGKHYNAIRIEQRKIKMKETRIRLVEINFVAIFFPFSSCRCNAFWILLGFDWYAIDCIERKTTDSVSFI